MKPDASQNPVSSPSTGATSANQKGARTPESVKGNATTKNPNPTYDITPNSEGKVGPTITGGDGLSTSPKTRVNPGQVDYSVKVSDLPEGLKAVRDGETHISIRPSREMTMADYQKKLNEIPWTKVQGCSS